MMKFKLNDMVWVIDRRIKCCKVVARSFFESMDMDSMVVTKIEYSLEDGDSMVKDYREGDVFESLTDLVNEKTLPYES